MSILGIFLGKQQSPARSVESPLDLVMSAAGLASEPHQIDPSLNKVREITANLQAGQTIGAADELALLQIYLQIEQYLITTEPLRSFTKDQLRRRANEQLRLRLEQLESKVAG